MADRVPGDLSIVSNRLSSVEREAQRPMQLLASVAADMDSMKRYTVERAGRRSRFLWLFGTDDWLGASWPDQSKRIEAARIASRSASRLPASPRRRERPEAPKQSAFIPSTRSEIRPRFAFRRAPAVDNSLQ